jgi:hypothetical protein
MPGIMNSHHMLFVVASAQLTPNIATGNGDNVVRRGEFLSSTVLTGCLWRPRCRVAAHHGHCPQPRPAWGCGQGADQMPRHGAHQLYVAQPRPQIQRRHQLSKFCELLLHIYYTSENSIDLVPVSARAGQSPTTS